MRVEQAVHPKSIWVATRGYVGPRWPEAALFDVPVLFIFDVCDDASSNNGTISTCSPHD